MALKQSFGSGGNSDTRAANCDVYLQFAATSGSLFPWNRAGRPCPRSRESGITIANARPLMPTELSSLFFRKLRMLYCSELQLISFLPELTARASERDLRARLQQELELSRQRRDTLEVMAATHQISSAGDDCDSMRRLINESREALREAAWHFPGDDDLRAISGALHRLQILNYGVARSLANRMRLADDVDQLDGLLDLLLDRYPETCDAPVPAGLLARY